MHTELIFGTRSDLDKLHCKNIIEQFVFPINLSIFDKRFIIMNSQAKGIEETLAKGLFIADCLL